MIVVERSPVLVRGVGDVGSAVAAALFRAGYAVALHDEPAPAAPRRGMAFADAVFDGTVTLDGLSALRVDTSAELRDALTAREVVPVTVAPFSQALNAAAWSAVIDARMRKRAIPERQRGFAPLTIGLGPNFIAGETVDLAIETMWGDKLGAIIEAGPTLPLAGEPRAIGGVGRARFVYAPAGGRFETSARIGDRVEENAVVASIGHVALRAPIGGVIRGLTRNGVEVAIRTKVVEVDPRGEPAAAFGLGERPRRIAEGVLKALSRARVLEPSCGVGHSRRTLLRATAALAAAVPTVNFGVSAAEPDIPNVAAAADLNYALKEIADGFAKATGRQVKLTFGSSGNFATQIRNGAPFQVFLCADEEYVQALAKEGRTDGDGTLYAIGRIGLFAPKGSPLQVDSQLRGLAEALKSGKVSKFAIANPEHAPYGRAAEAALRRAGLWDELRPKLILGENVSQATQFAVSGSAAGGIIPLSLAKSAPIAEAGAFALIPADWHPALRQRMVLLKGAGQTARAFYDYVEGPAARAVFRRYGFVLPGEAAAAVAN